MRLTIGLAALALGFCFSTVRGAITAADGPPFNFARDTFAFPNETVFGYHEGIAYARKAPTQNEGKKPYTRRCFVMSRAVVQFKKFARFEPTLPPPSDAELARRVRIISRRHPWNAPWPTAKRVVFPGYKDLRELSEKRGLTLQQNLGLGWPTYARVGNWRMFSVRGREYQTSTHAELEKTLASGDFFVGYLTTFPRLSINHAVLFYAHRSGIRSRDGDHYWVYDPNHPDKPRPLDYSSDKHEFSYVKDWDFVGGSVRVYHVFGKAWQ